jgi:transcriptional regulator with XRE-family HTH domain
MIVTLGDRVRKFRIAAELTQDELRAALAKNNVILNDTAISKIENGNRKVSVEELFALAESLGVSMSCISNGYCTTNEDFEKLTSSMSEVQKKQLMRAVEHNIPLIKEFSPDNKPQPRSGI